MKKLRPRAINELVAVERCDFLSETGDALHHAIGFLTALGRVEDDHFTHARHAVMTAHDGDNFRGVPGNGACVKKRVRPVGVAAVVRLLVGAVRKMSVTDAKACGWCGSVFWERPGGDFAAQRDGLI